MFRSQWRRRDSNPLLTLSERPHSKTVAEGHVLPVTPRPQASDFTVRDGFTCGTACGRAHRLQVPRHCYVRAESASVSCHKILGVTT